MALESMIEKDAREFMEAKGGMCLKFVSPNNNGVPDRVLSHPNCGPFWCEFKSPTKKMEPHQENVAKQMAKAGFRVYRNVSNIRKAREIIHDEIAGLGACGLGRHQPAQP